ncbi:MAG: hypothetical protein LAO07_00980 [Acidobacteriia bacterium]|nr:hypothetical protein [Terriglobia bacterium]
MRKTLLIAAAIILIGPGTLLGGPAVEPSGDTGASLSSQDAAQSGRNAVLTVPAQTEAAIQLLSGIHSQVSHVGDLVTAELLQAVYVNGRVALPTGSVIGGRITRIRPAGRMRRPAEMVLRFDSITLPDGQEEPCSAGLSGLDSPLPKTVELDSEGQLRGSRGFSWKRLAGGFFGLGTFAFAEAQLASAAALGASLPIGGAAVLGYTFLIPRGNEVHVPPDTRFRIRLHQPVTVRVAW